MQLGIGTLTSPQDYGYFYERITVRSTHTSLLEVLVPWVHLCRVAQTAAGLKPVRGHLRRQGIKMRGRRTKSLNLSELRSMAGHVLFVPHAHNGDGIS